MNGYFAYIRVSTVKQGEKGSSLQEQQAAIDAYARRHGLRIVQWFEELETAAKGGRPVFTNMLKGLERRGARGVIAHKIDRSARNLRDWAALGELVDKGVELHLAHESLDLTSRGGRLSADIQAVVAADYIRNLRDEVRKGFYGRLRQGLYPIGAPIGYVDQGRARPKTIDPFQGPLVVQAFELYSSGQWSLETLGMELYRRGLRNKRGGPVTRNGLSTLLNNPFYVGVIRLKKTGEVFKGVHAPLISKELFDRTRDILHGRLTHKANLHQFRYQRMLKCASCKLSLVCSRVKGHVYYRCQTKTCPTTCLREELIDEALSSLAPQFRMTDADAALVSQDIELALAARERDRPNEIRGVTLAIAAVDERLNRLTDAYLDNVVDRDLYFARKEKLLFDRAGLLSRKVELEQGDNEAAKKIDEVLQLIKALGNMPRLGDDHELRSILKNTTSNLFVDRKNVVIAWETPFDLVVANGLVTVGGPDRGKTRTKKLKAITKLAVRLVRSKKFQLSEEMIEEMRLRKKTGRPGYRNIIEYNRKRQVEKDIRTLRDDMKRQDE